MINIIAESIEELRVWDYLENSSLMYSIEDTTQVDVTLIGMHQSSWTIEKGKRTHRDYANDAGEIVVSFIYVYDEDDEGNVVSIDRKIQYLCYDGTVGLEKDILKELSDTYIVTLNREIRQNQIDNLRGKGASLRAKGVALGEPYQTQYATVADNVDFLWVHYKDQIEEYIQTGNSTFKDVIIGETDPSVNGILDIVASQNGDTVETTIITEIN